MPPGCTKLSREIRVVDGLDRVDIINVLDKKAVRQKEGVHFGFAFNVPAGVMRMDIAWGVIRPETDQLPGACRNYFTVGRWVDVSNQDYGVTWATVDAPLVEAGGMTIYDIGPQNGPGGWLEHLKPSQTLYSYVMNNHWGTNYKADQEGPTTFRYALLPHKQYDPAAAERFGIECSQPLVAVPARGSRAQRASLPRTGHAGSDRGLGQAERRPQGVHRPPLRRRRPAGRGRPALGRTRPKAVYLSNLAEDQGEAVAGPIRVPAWGLVTLRAEL